MLAGHMDELGFQIIYIDDRGYLYFDTIGGFDLGMVPGRKVRIHAQGSRAGCFGEETHSPDASRRTLQSACQTRAVDRHWRRFGRRSAQDSRDRRSRTYDPNFEELRGDLVVSRATDNKAGAWVVAEALRRVTRAKKPCRAALFSVATVQEEIGLRGAKTSAHGVNPLVGIAVDVTWAMDHPGVDKRQVGECVLGGGPVINRGANINPVVFDRLVAVAKKKKIPHQVMAEPGGTGPDANAIQLSRAGVAAALVSLPQRYMHTPVEVISLKISIIRLNYLPNLCCRWRKTPALSRKKDP